MNSLSLFFLLIFSLILHLAHSFHLEYTKPWIGVSSHEDVILKCEKI